MPQSAVSAKLPARGAPTTASHSFPCVLEVHKMDAEVKEILARKEAKLQLKAERRQKQEADVERKRRQREAHR